ncbi:copper amine oxidase N-terminal domain-containing protein [Chengkuizengella sediminis]|uniref:copper amine oxidase N-terminal domain-containing protein n=1 Tax=Chengkuizengella sediminis TaxID=1885917 RepID=UPI00138997EF|nr:copper amine oxidase N-terminal domain-containing protein [Chengkuizengella sediminis]NDI36681.1 copper amine oxidase N-terminal domain-containing protein [Chengkuizengella sediminis]
MKKTSILISVVILSIIFSSTAFAAEETKIEVWIDGEQLLFEEEPFIENGTTLIPFRVLFSELGLNVKWNQETKTITGENKSLTVELTLNSNQAVVNGKSIEMLVEPQLVNNHTFVPLRFVGESTGANVSWDGSTKTISITSPEPRVNEEERIIELFNQYEDYYNEENLEIISLFEDQFLEDWGMDTEFEWNFENYNDHFEIKDLEILSNEDNEAYVYVVETYERIDGSFYLDEMYEQIYTLVKSENDKWLINDLEITLFEYINLEKIKNSNVDFPEKDEKEILTTFQKYLDSIKEENLSKLKSTLHEEYIELLDLGWLEEYYEEYLFTYYNYTFVQIEEASVVNVYEDEVTLFIHYNAISTYENIGEVEVEMDESLIKFKKSKNGKWKIIEIESINQNIEFE